MTDSPPLRRSRLDDGMNENESNNLNTQDQIYGSVYILIPSAMCGLVRGKNSSTIRDFKERSGAKAAKFLLYANSPDGCVPNSNEQILRIYGALESVVNLIGLVQQTFNTHGQDLENYYDGYTLRGSLRKRELRIITVNQICSAIVGTRGQTVKEIESNTETSIAILPRKGAMADLVNEKVIVVTSESFAKPNENIKNAVRKLLHIIFTDRFAHLQEHMPLSEPFQFPGGPLNNAPPPPPPLMQVPLQGNYGPPPPNSMGLQSSMGMSQSGPQPPTSMSETMDIQQQLAVEMMKNNHDRKQNEEKRRRDNQLLESMLTDEQYQLFTTTGRPAFSRSLLDSLHLFNYTEEDLHEVGIALECIAKATLILDSNMKILTKHNLGGLAMTYAAAMSNRQAMTQHDQDTNKVFGHLMQMKQRQPSLVDLFSARSGNISKSQQFTASQILSRHLPVSASGTQTSFGGGSVGNFNEPIYSSPNRNTAQNSDRLVDDVLKALPQATETKLEIEIPTVIVDALFYERSPARQHLQTIARVQVTIRPGANGNEIFCMQGQSKESITIAQNIVRNVVSEEIQTRMSTMKNN